MKNIVFLDCGFHHGEGLIHFCENMNIHEGGSLIFCWEPNPACQLRERLFKIRQKYDTYIPKNIWIGNKEAVWIANEMIEFRQENHLISQSGSPHDNESGIDGWGSQVASLNGTFKGLEPAIQVPAVDFSKHVKMIFQATGIKPFCKMDIEGSEFPVLRKILKDGTAGLFKKMWIEFHERFIPGENIRTKIELIRELEKYTEVEEWH